MYKRQLRNVSDTEKKKTIAYIAKCKKAQYCNCSLKNTLS